MSELVLPTPFDPETATDEDLIDHFERAIGWWRFMADTNKQEDAWMSRYFECKNELLSRLNNVNDRGREVYAK